MKKCKSQFGICRCGAEYIKAYNGKLCPDCAVRWSHANTQRSVGDEALDQHFRQDIGIRLQRAAWGHFTVNPNRDD